jgi:hypothetical protein
MHAYRAALRQPDSAIHVALLLEAGLVTAAVCATFDAHMWASNSQPLSSLLSAGFVSKTYDPDSGEQGYGCYIAVDATKEGLAANTFECGCGRGCAMKDCGIWNRTKVCNCNSGCACGGFYPASKSEYLGYYAFGVTGKSTNATRCSVNEPLGMDDNWYYRIPTMHIRGCAGPN